MHLDAGAEEALRGLGCLHDNLCCTDNVQSTNITAGHSTMLEAVLTEDPAARISRGIISMG